MFDNEIDWVTHRKSDLSAARPHKWRVSSECVKYKAEHMQRVGVSH